MIIKYLDKYFNKITMYKLVIASLGSLVVFAIIFSAMGKLYISLPEMMLSLVTLSLACLVFNVFFGWIFNAPVNHESASITALILFFVLAPASNLEEVIKLVLVAAIAIGSKFILAPYKRHIFNPAAIASFVAPVLGLGFALWWVGSSILFIPALIVELLVVRKIRRFTLFLSVIVSSVVVVGILGISRGIGLQESISQHFLSWPIIFFASIMATEPLTTPPTKKLQVIYGLLVGALSGIPFNVGNIHNTPELSLLLGNLFSYAVSLKRRLNLELIDIKEIAHQTFELKFKQDFPLAFTAGQYLEWTLPHPRADIRGIRRYFTIASSPTEKEIILGVKSADKLSSFKQALFALKPGQKIVAGQLSGDFVLPKDQNSKLVFIAGGIGITPFRSMIKHMLDNQEQRDIILFYSNKTAGDIAYSELFKSGEAIGLKTIYMVTEPNSAWVGETGYLNSEVLSKYCPDYTSRITYISGPSGMVDSYKAMLIKAGVKRSKIITDYFPGLA